MTSAPYMKFFWGDYHKKTRHLTRDQHGAYFLLIGEAWQRDGTLPDDDAKLAAWALASREEWAAMKPVIMDFFVYRRGKWIHDRVREELSNYESTSRKRKEAGKRGGSGKKSAKNAINGNIRENLEAIASDLPKQKESPLVKPEPESEPLVIGIGLGREREGENPAKPIADDWPPARAADVLVAMARSPRLDPHKAQGLTTSAGEVERWRRGGCDWSLDVLPIVLAEAAKPGCPIRTWGYFTQAITNQRERRLSPLPPASEDFHERPHGQNRTPASPTDLRRASTEARRNAWADAIAARNPVSDFTDLEPGGSGTGEGGGAGNLRLVDASARR